MLNNEKNNLQNEIKEYQSKLQLKTKLIEELKVIIK